MSKELPYFRFYADEWINGNITLENEGTQGLFILICSWYWREDCSINLDFIKRRTSKGKAMLERCLKSLIDADIIQVIDNDFIRIKFLDEQHDLLGDKRNKRVEAGRKGGQAKPKQSLNKAKAIKIDKDKIRVDKNKFVPPTLDEWKSYFKEKGYLESIAITSWTGYEEANPPWTDTKGKKIRSWKQKVNNVWFKDEHKMKESEIKKGPSKIQLWCENSECAKFHVPFLVDKRPEGYDCGACDGELTGV